MWGGMKNVGIPCNTFSILLSQHAGQPDHHQPSTLREASSKQGTKINSLAHFRGLVAFPTTVRLTCLPCFLLHGGCTMEKGTACRACCVNTGQRFHNSGQSNLFNATSSPSSSSPLNSKTWVWRGCDWIGGQWFSSNKTRISFLSHLNFLEITSHS